MMRRKLLLLTITILTMTSCRSDDSKDSNSLPNQIKGKWFYTKTVIISGDNSAILSNEIANSCEKKSFLEFTDDKVTEYYYKLENNECNLNYSGTSLYHIENNILYYETNASMRIESLNTSELIFQIELYDYNGDGKKDKFLEYYQK